VSVVTLTIDDTPVSAATGDTILTAARDAGLPIPTLCYLEGVSTVGACRLCVVEVQGAARPQAACVTRVAEGMVVQTVTERLREYRRLVLEMLLAERNHVCAVCVVNGACELQAQAMAAGVDHVRLEYLFPSHRMDLTHERFGLDHNRCILCTRCVRACDELEGAHTWDVAGRGVKSWVVTDMNAPWGSSSTCTSCGKCVQACPTGALFQQGSTVQAMAKHPRQLTVLKTARERKMWIA
jgi:bidirectional [NiFe] hydrogenase diaphorase subunit